MAVPDGTLSIIGKPFSSISTPTEGVERNDDTPVEAIIPPFTLQDGVIKTLKCGTYVGIAKLFSYPEFFWTFTAVGVAGGSATGLYVSKYLDGYSDDTYSFSIILAIGGALMGAMLGGPLLGGHIGGAGLEGIKYDMKIRDAMRNAYKAAGCQDPPSSPPRETQESNPFAPPAKDDRPSYDWWHKFNWMLQDHPSEVALIAAMSALSIVAPSLMARGVGPAPTGATAGYGFAVGLPSQQEQQIY